MLFVVAGPGTVNIHPTEDNKASANFWWSTFNLWNDILSANVVSKYFSFFFLFFSPPTLCAYAFLYMHAYCLLNFAA